MYPTGLSLEGAGANFTLVLFSSVDKGTLMIAGNACQDLARRMPAPSEALRPPSPAALHHMRQWTQCLRDNGQAGFPDPNSDGKFPILNPPEEGAFDVRDLTPAMHAALNACQQYTGDWEMKAS